VTPVDFLYVLLVVALLGGGYIATNALYDWIAKSATSGTSERPKQGEQ
jgi:hypothetical protein